MSYENSNTGYNISNEMNVGNVFSVLLLLMSSCIIIIMFDATDHQCGENAYKADVRTKFLKAWKRQAKVKVDWWWKLIDDDIHLSIDDKSQLLVKVN